MALLRNPEKQLRLQTVCARGGVAEWDPHSQELLGVYDLNIGESRIKLCTMSRSYICTFISLSSEFRVFDSHTKVMIGSF